MKKRKLTIKEINQKSISIFENEIASIIVKLKISKK